MSAEELAIRLDETVFEWFEVLGVSPAADKVALRWAMSRLALACHPDKGGNEADMVRINEAYAQGCAALA